MLEFLGMILRLAFLIVLLSTGNLGTVLWGQEKEKKPSLAELARRQRERRAASGKKTQVITNEDLATMGSARLATGATTPTGASGEDRDLEDALESLGEELGQRLELEEWKRAFDEARLKVEKAVSEVMALQLQTFNIRYRFGRQSEAGTRTQLEKSMELLYEARQEEEEARQEVEKLQREATKAGLTRRQIRELTGTLPESSPNFDPVTFEGDERPPLRF